MLRRTFLSLAAVLPWALPSQMSGAARPAAPSLQAKTESAPQTREAKAEPAAPKPKAKAGATVQATITGIAFLEIKQPVTVGDTIEWINKDVVPHTATARNKDWRVVIPASDKATLIVTKPGTVEFYCEYHPNMTGRLVVRSRNRAS